MIPLTFFEIRDFNLNSSRAWIFEMWTSITGDEIAAIESEIPTEVCVYAAAFRTIPSQLKPTSWILLIN